MDNLTKEIATQLCTEIRQKYQGRWYTLAGMQCWGCHKFSKGDPAKMCFSSKPDYTGCNLVNRLYAERAGK